MTLSDLGYNAFFESGRKQAGLSGFPVARVIAEHRGSYRVTDGGHEYTAKVTGKRMYEASSRKDYPVVGDWVAFESAGPGQAVIRGIIPRRSMLSRKEVVSVSMVVAGLSTAPADEKPASGGEE